MTKIYLALVSVLAFFVLALAPAPAQASLPSALRAPVDLYHPYQGNDQAFSIMCTTGHGPFWVQKGQYAFQKCAYGDHRAHSVDVGNNFQIICQRLSDGATWYIPGSSGPTQLPAGPGYPGYNCWTNHTG